MVLDISEFEILRICKHYLEMITMCEDLILMFQLLIEYHLNINSFVIKNRVGKLYNLSVINV